MTARTASDAPLVVKRKFPRFLRRAVCLHGWKMFPSIERVYVNERARNELGWQQDTISINN